jgi:hypothetical protein
MVALVNYSNQLKYRAQGEFQERDIPHRLELKAPTKL